MLWSWIKRRVLVPLRVSLKNGISHQRLAVSLALGIIIGLIPFYGLTTLLIAILALALRLDLLLMQVVHFIVAPLQIVLLLPFIKLGNHLIAGNAIDFSAKEYLLYFKSDFWLALNEFWKLNLSAIVIWLIVSIPLFILLYRGFLYSIARYAPVIVGKRPFRK